MDAEGIFFSAERGIHVLFDIETIVEAFEQDELALQVMAEHRRTDVELILVQLLALPDAVEARRFIASLPREFQHVLVLLYFEVLDGRLAASQTRH